MKQALDVTKVNIVKKNTSIIIPPVYEQQGTMTVNEDMQDALYNNAIYYFFDVNPVPSPRINYKDKFLFQLPPHKLSGHQQKRRQKLNEYYESKKSIQLQASLMKFNMPSSGYHIFFFVPVPKSLSNTLMGKPLKKKPDKDNLEKTFLDAVCKSDSHIYSGGVSKFYGTKQRGWIVVRVGRSEVLRESTTLLNMLANGK